MKNNIAIALTVISIHSTNAAEETSFPELLLSSSSEEKFVDIVQYLANEPSNAPMARWDGSSQILTLEVAVNENQYIVRSSKKHSTTRNYNIPVSQSEKEDLTYITNTMARNSLPSIATSKSSLKKAGDRIEHLHPLRFLMTIFTDEELKANIHAIRSRGWIWDKFYDGLEGSLKDESKKDNMKIEFVIDFANTIGINVDLIQPAIQEKRWKDLVNVLIDTIPRSGNPGRYDM